MALPFCQGSKNETNWMEQFSDAYLHAVATIARVEIGQTKTDHGKVDWYLIHEDIRIMMFFQSKSQLNPTVTDNHVVYEFKADAYNKLASTPRNRAYLVLMCLPPERACWHSQSHWSLHLRNCMLYYRLDDKEQVNNKASLTIKIPLTQIVTPEWLVELYEELRDEE